MRKALFNLALILQTKIFLWLLAVAGGLFAFGVFFLILLKRHIKAIPNASALRRRLFFKRALIFTLWPSVALVLAAAVSITQTVSGLQYSTSSISGSPVRITGGTALQALQWLTLGLSVLFALGVTAIFDSRSAPVGVGQSPSVASGAAVRPSAAPFGLAPPSGPSGPPGFVL